MLALAWGDTAAVTAVCFTALALVGASTVILCSMRAAGRRSQGRGRSSSPALREGSASRTIVGEVVGDAELRGPISGESCVLWCLDRSGDEASRRSERDFFVEDATGRVRVRPLRFEFSSRREDERFGAPCRGRPASGRGRREAALRPGARVAIFGELLERNGERVMTAPTGGALLISTRSESDTR